MNVRFFFKEKIQSFFLWKGLLGKILFFLSVLILFAGFIPFSSSLLRETIVQSIRKSLAGSCSLEKASISLWRGIYLKKLHIAGSTGQGGTVFEVKIPHVRIPCRLFRLTMKYLAKIKNFPKEPLSGKLIVKSENMIRDTLTGKWLSKLPFLSLVKGVIISRANFIITRNKQELYTGQRIDLAVRFSGSDKLKGHAFAGLLETDQGWKLQSVNASFSTNGSRIYFKKCKAGFYNGRALVSAAYNLSGNILEEFNFKISQIDLEKVYEASKIKKGTLTGKADLFIELQRSVLAADSLKGMGSIEISNLSAYMLPLQRTDPIVEFMPGLSSMKFSSIRSNLKIKDGRIYTESIVGKGESISFYSSGWIGYNGRFRQNVNATLSRKFVSSLPKLVSFSLPVTKDGGRSFECTVKGTFARPELTLDEKFKGRAVRQIFKNIGKNLMELFE